MKHNQTIIKEMLALEKRDGLIIIPGHHRIVGIISLSDYTEKHQTLATSKMNIAIHQELSKLHSVLVKSVSSKNYTVTAQAVTDELTGAHIQTFLSELDSFLGTTSDWATIGRNSDGIIKPITEDTSLENLLIFGITWHPDFPNHPIIQALPVVKWINQRLEGRTGERK